MTSLSFPPARSSAGPARPAGRAPAPFADAGQPLPRRFEHGWDSLLLALVVVGDFASFRIVLALVTNGSELLLWPLTLSMTALAVLCMHQAGRVVRDRDAAAHTAGRGVVACLVALWVAMGVAAAALRVLNPITSTAATDLLTGAAPADTGPTATAWVIALALLVVYLAGGVAAFVIGHRSHNPLRSSILHEQSVVDRRRRQLRRAEARAHRSSRRRRGLAGARSALDRVESVHGSRVARLTAEAAALRGMTPSLVLSHGTAARLQLAAERRQLVGLAADREVAAAYLRETEQAASESERTSLARTSERRARARAGELRQAVRLRLAENLGEPAATSGIFAERG